MPVIRVASVPASLVYVGHLSDPGGKGPVLIRHRRPLVYSVHDLRNPHLSQAHTTVYERALS